MVWYAEIVNREFLRFSVTLFIVILVSLSLALAYDRQVNSFISAVNLDAKDQLIASNQNTIDYYEKQNKSVQAELEARNKELDAKKTELDKTNSDLTAKIKELNSAKSQLSSTASELSKLRERPPLFVFKVDSNLTNVDQKKEDVKNLVTAAYDEIVSIYSKPYLLHSVTINFVNSFSNPNASAEIVIENGSDGLQLTIKIKDFDRNSFDDNNSIIHEIIHSFHGLAALETVADEEGITVAATDAVMSRLISQGKIPSFNPLYIRISSSDYASSSLTVPRDTTSFYTSSDTGKYYQLVGYGWYQLYKADPNFFKIFNEKMYASKRQGQDMTESLVRQNIVASVSGQISGKSVNDWLQTKAFVFR
jgi:Skp family chaperone for outer membrane proteins